MNENSLVGAGIKKSVRKRKFNIIDFLLILIVIAVIASAAYIFFPSSIIRNITADKTEEIQYTLELTGVDEEYLESIKEGDTVLDSVSKSNIGTVDAVDFGIQHTELVYSESNKAGVLSPVSGKYNVIVTVSAAAKYKEGEGYSVNGTRIAVGEKINARFPNYICECYCISIPLD